MNSQNKAFTLVELIVVITILAVLGTIAFISLQGFSRDARDSARISDLKNIEKGFELLLTKGSSLPEPEDYVEISASGTVISYQGYAGKKVMGNARVFGGGKDPLDDRYYTYLTDTNFRNYQLLGFLEQGEQIALNTNILKQSKALDYSSRYPIIKGKPLGIIVNSTTMEPIQVTGSGIDIVTEISDYTAYINNNKKISNNKDISTYFSFTNKNMLKNDSNFLGYWYLNNINEGTDLSYGNNNLNSNNGVIFNKYSFFDKSIPSYLEGNNITLGTDFTILMKFNVKDHTSWSSSCHNTAIIGQHHNGGCANNHWGLGYTHLLGNEPVSKKIIFNYGNGDAGGWLFVTSNSQYELNKDIFVGFVKKGEEYFMYVNGILDGTGSIINMQDNLFNLRIGGTDGNFFDGNIYYGAILDYSLSEELVKVLSDSLWIN